MNVKLLTEHHLEFLSLKGGCKGSSEPTLVKMSDCLKSHAAAQIKNNTCVWLALVCAEKLTKAGKNLSFGSSFIILSCT